MLGQLDQHLHLKFDKEARCAYAGRPVECPNSCGATLQHQDLEEHVSTQWPLSYVGGASCNAKVYTKDVPSDVELSLLARENRNLKLLIQEQGRMHRMQRRRIRKSIDLLGAFTVLLVCSQKYDESEDITMLVLISTL